MEYGIDINFTPSELKALFKSIGIGCEQLMKKAERLEGTKYEEEVVTELRELMDVHNKISGAMTTVYSEIRFE